MVETHGATAVGPDQIFDVEADVLAPCALGSAIRDDTVGRLRVQIVAGAANNQLDEDRHGEALAGRGILYAPDYVINSGGVLHGTGLELLGWDQPRLDDALRGLGETLKELYADDGRSPVHAAEALVARRRDR
jgi:leucine dehydrogenase